MVPHGQKPYPLWDQATGKIKTEIPAEGEDPVLHHMQAGGGGCVKLMDKQLAKMRKRLLEGPPPKNQEGEGGEEEVPESDGTVSELSVKSDYNVIREMVDVSDEEVVHVSTRKGLAPTSKAKAIEKSKESKGQGKKDPRPPLPRLRREEKDEKKKDERPPLERKVSGKGKGSAVSARPALSNSTSKGKVKDSAVPVRQFVKPSAKGYEGDDSEEDSPAKPKETIDHLKKEVEDLKAEKAKSKPAEGRKYSARQESDKRAAGGRVAYIKEKQRRRAAKARAAGVKERAEKRLANEEAYEKESNQEGRGRKRQPFPLSTGGFAEDKERRR